MDITRFAIERSRVTLVALLVVYAAGISAYFGLPRSEDPGFTIRTALVITYFPGASPERVEQLVTDKLEKAIQEIPELDNVKSENKTGTSVVIVDIKERYAEMRPIWDSLRRKVERVRPDLPEGIIGPFVNDEFGDVFGIIVTVEGEGFSYAELKEVADQVRDELLRLPDVAKVEIHGAQEEHVFIEFTNARLSELGLSPLQLQTILENRNIIIPGGEILIGQERISLEPSGNFESVEDLKRTVVQLPGRTEVIYLQDLVDIERGYVDPPTTKVTSSGEPCLALAISMREGGNLIDLGGQVKRSIQQLEGDYPIGIEFDTVAFQPDVVERKVTGFVMNVQQAVLVVIAVMLIMLGIRTGLIVASLIPSSMVMALMFMDFFEIGLNQISLSALIIALGMLVDNAIVMAESIMVEVQGGKNRLQAAIDSSRELRVPLLTSSLTTAAAFLPIYLAESTTGEYTAPLFKVVTITLLCSWFLALTMIPFLCFFFLKVRRLEHGQGFNSRFYRTYRTLLIGALKLRLPALLLVATVFVVAMTGFSRVPQIFFPPSDTAMFTAELELPLGTAIEHTENVVSEIDAFVRRELAVNQKRPAGVSNWSTYIGQGAPRFVLSYSPEQRAPEYAYMILNATSLDMLPSLIERLAGFCQEFTDLSCNVSPLKLGPIIKHPVEIRISGPDINELFEISEVIKSKLTSIRGTKGVGDNWGQRTKKLLIKIDEPRARRSGVTNQDIAISLLSVLSGFETTNYREEDKVIPITLRSVAADRRDIGKLESLNVYAQATGQSVPLKQVADIEVEWQPAKVFRRNRSRTITIYCSVDGVTAAEVVAEMRPWLANLSKDWNVGVFLEFGGEEETSVKANQSIADKLPVAGLSILILLVGQFNSMRRALIILVTIPLGLIGVVVGLLAAKSYMGFMTFLGIISLAGIVINNAIVLLDRIQLEIQEHGLAPRMALIEASQRRLRPILLTTLTTIGGLIPLWYGGGPMFEPMAIAIIFGLGFSTVLTLGVVPVVYSVLFRLNFRGFQYSDQEL